MSRLALKPVEVGFAAVFRKRPPAAADHARTVGDHAALGISRVFAAAHTEVRVAIGDHVDALGRRDRLDIFQPMCATCLCSLSVQSMKRLQFKRPMIGQINPESGRTSGSREPGCLV